MGTAWRSFEQTWSWDWNSSLGHARFCLPACLFHVPRLHLSFLFPRRAFCRALSPRRSTAGRSDAEMLAVQMQLVALQHVLAELCVSLQHRGWLLLRKLTETEACMELDRDHALARRNLSMKLDHKSARNCFCPLHEARPEVSMQELGQSVWHSTLATHALLRILWQLLLSQTPSC
eukprot:3480299-Pleurochrysis_carterae.AAC.1